MYARNVHTPKKFEAAVLNQFQSAENISYLSYYLNRPDVDVAQNVINFVPIAQDLLLNPSVLQTNKDFWSEVKRLNTNFVNYMMSAQRLDVGGRESYHLQMFQADSLYPPGHERLNERHETTAPFDSHRHSKRQYDLALPAGQWVPNLTAYGGKQAPKLRAYNGSDMRKVTHSREQMERFAPTPDHPFMDRRDDRGNIGPNPSQACGEDDAWDAGDPYKSVDDRLQEYINSDFQQVYGDKNGPRDRYFRYEEFPFWQYPKAGRGTDRTPSANLCQVRGEYDNPVYGWASSGYLAD